MFAPNFHKAMKYVGPARKKMGKKTIFNLIGPLSSPAKVKKQIVGVFDKKWMEPFAEALKENQVTNAFIVNSEDGMDEISPFAKTKVVELKNNEIKKLTIDPVSLGISLKNQENLKGKDALYNSNRIIEIFEGKVDEFSEAVSLNAAAGLVISNKSQDFKNAFDNVRKHLKSGQVKNFLEKIRS